MVREEIIYIKGPLDDAFLSDMLELGKELRRSCNVAREWLSIFEACTCHQFFDETLPVGVADPLLDIDALVRDSSLTEDVRICHQVLRAKWSE